MHYLIRFVAAKTLVGYGMDIMLNIFSVCNGIVSDMAAGMGGISQAMVALPGEVQSAIENVGFLASIPLWLVTILGSLFITVLSFVMILTVYGRFFRLYMYTALAPLPLASFAGESTQSVGISFIKSYVGVCLEGAVIVLACVIYAAFVSTPTVSGGEASVKNQRDLLNDFYRRNIDEFESITEYVDDGHTGTDANREDFQRLLADVMSGKINCVIVKDLSRFARNYSDAGSLIDNLFVQMGVRFISLAENVDSYKNPDSVSNIIVPITNVMNDNYCYQTSKKIRQVFDYKRRNGQYIGAFAPYGYVKHPKDKHRLIVDPDAAENVKLIFTMLIQGSSKRAIALYLNEHGVPSPSAYKVQKGLPVSTRGYDDPMWGARMIHSILTNPTYTGDLAQGRSRVKSYKVHQIEAVPREEWVEVAGTHEAIIDYETFDKVQALLQRDTRTSPKGREVHLFSGFLKCADCGRAITRCVGKNNNVYYSCSTYKNRSRTACTMHSIKHERLEAAVLFAVQHQVHLAVSYSEIVTQINSAPIKKSQSYRLDDLIAAKERELTKITRYKQSLYQDWKDGEITQQEYRDMKADYERQTSDISAVLTRLNAERAELANGVDNEHPALVAFMKYQNIEALNREILVELVDYIKVYENGNISVKFKFADELRKIAEYIEINTTEDTAVAG